MKAVATFEFEGEQLTVTQIRARVPALGDATIRRYLAAGRNTRAAMLGVSVSAGRAASGRAAAKRAKASGTEPRCASRRRA